MPTWVAIVLVSLIHQPGVSLIFTWNVDSEASCKQIIEEVKENYDRNGYKITKVECVTRDQIEKEQGN